MCKVYCCDGGLLDSEAGSSFPGYSAETVLLCGELESFDGETDCYLRSVRWNFWHQEEYLWILFYLV